MDSLSQKDIPSHGDIKYREDQEEKSWQETHLNNIDNSQSILQVNLYQRKVLLQSWVHGSVTGYQCFVSEKNIYISFAL